MKIKTKQQYLDLLEETIAYYSEDTSRRSVDNDNECYYTHPETGNHCAVGRCLTKASRENVLSCIVNDQDVETLLKDPSYEFCERYKGYDVNFWLKLQSLHDGCGNWCNGGLSYRGDLVANSIKRWINNHFDQDDKRTKNK